MAYLIEITETGVMDYTIAIAGNRNDLLAILMQITKACGVPMPETIYDDGTIHLIESRHGKYSYGSLWVQWEEWETGVIDMNALPADVAQRLP